MKLLIKRIFMERLLRIEKDFLGEKEIDPSKYFGIQTLRAK